MTFFFWYFAVSAIIRLLLFLTYREEAAEPPTRGSSLGSAITFALVAAYAYTGSQIVLYAILLYVVTVSAFLIGAKFAKERR